MGFGRCSVIEANEREMGQGNVKKASRRNKTEDKDGGVGGGGGVTGLSYGNVRITGCDEPNIALISSCSSAP